MSPTDNIEITRWETLKGRPATTMMTTRPGVFAAGDAVSGPLTVGAWSGWWGTCSPNDSSRHVTTGTCVQSEGQWMEDLIAENRKRDLWRAGYCPDPGSNRRQAAATKTRCSGAYNEFSGVDSGFTQRSSFIEASRVFAVFTRSWPCEETS